MIKRILAVFALSVLIVSSANATYSLSVTGTSIDILSDVAIAKNGGQEMYYALLCTKTKGIISGGAVFPTGAGFSITVQNNAVTSGGIPVPAGTDGVWGNIFTNGGNIPAGKVISAIHYTGNFPVTVDLYKVNSNWTLGSKLAAIVVPEPATLALLGLGGLLLSRKFRFQ